ncbi:MAG TPA: helix-turn-helix transcriptional regulator [Solirubrobacteraceae bacterium]|jgi:DNA-binding PadR family transcriptional regulator|nr:helix-turn-helix transcriptional regulator [Solirubrobacteraceae bacterium]
MGEVVATEASAATLRSPVSWGLLGLVIQRPSYGYELVQRFERTYGDALSLSSPSQIYTALDTLARRGLIEELPVEDAPSSVVRQPKLHYRATARGVGDYQGWLISQIDDERRRSRLFAHQLAILPPDAALAVIERYEQACLREASAATIPDSDGSYAGGADGLIARLLSENDRLALGAKLSWIEYLRRELTAPAPGRA